MKPLSFAVGILACYHFSEGSATAVAILWIFAVIVEIFLFVRLIKFSCIYLDLLSFQNLLLSFFLVFVLQLIGQHLLVLPHLTVELISYLFLFLRVAVELFLLAQNHLVVSLHLRWQFSLAFSQVFGLDKELILEGLECGLHLLDSLIELPYQPKVSIDVVGDCDHLVHEVIKVCVRHLFGPIYLLYSNHFVLHLSTSTKHPNQPCLNLIFGRSEMKRFQRA